MRKDKKIYTFLVIEDNLGDYVLIDEYLSEVFVNPISVNCRSFQEAKSILEGPEKIDLVFLDLSLPDLSGETLIKAVVESAQEIPVIALTGFSDLDFSIRSLSLGISDYLLKDELTPTVLYKSIIYSIERNKHIEELQHSEKRYSDLFHLNPTPMMVYDLATLKILNVNEAAIEAYGYSHQEFISMTLKDIRPDEDVPKLLQSVEDFWVNNNPNYLRISRHIKKSGEIIDVEISPAKITYNGKEGAMVLIQDITEKLKYIRTIENQNKTFREIAWIQSHVVRAPLARLMGLINLFESITESNSEKQELIKYIKASSEELDQIIRDISKKSEGLEDFHQKNT
ncbi:PAS domain S-box protein [Algoriphagus sp. CAU 1675]|uniref:PAS domain S-box protein n=1 Tax=Algoriphagus sp. CAU 1675 TaxID=3032597 RepID=UPI0023DC5B6B|nr:PAS domain S-box protein [Algoriphagus sp. CAU 1675]MDF2157063.1 PAS domain S-box protein [Algoriphagus sp. CAU 1675]